MRFSYRLLFAFRYATVHVLISGLVAILSAAVVFGLWYTAPYRYLLGVTGMYVLILAVDVVCGPLLTLVLASPKKSQRERWLDFSLIGLIQIAALAYGMHSVWLGRPIVLAFEVDRLVVVTANEIQTEQLLDAPNDLQHLPWAGVLEVTTRRPRDNAELFDSIDRGFSGVSLAMQPSWWLPWSSGHDLMALRSRPLADLIARRPKDASILQAAAYASGHDTQTLRYLPLVSRQTQEWVALLDAEMRMVGWAPVDGFIP